MGYESKIYVVDKTPTKDISDKFGTKDMYYAQVVTMFDLCKFFDMTELFAKETDCYFYADDGNTKVVEDRYGDKLTESTIEEMLEFLNSLSKEDSEYRRIPPFKALLQSFIDNKNQWGDLKLLHYGY